MHVGGGVVMIVSLTPNPSIDRAVTVDELRRGEVHRATASRIDPGGKGINVSRALAAMATPTRAVFPSGGPEGHLMEDLLMSAGVQIGPVAVSGSVRMNISVLEPDGTTTKLNEPGPTLSDHEVVALVGGVLGDAAQTTWVVGSGSLPPGASPRLYADLVVRAKDLGLRCAIDSSGEPMARAVAAKPHLIKPNHEELAELMGRPLATLGEVCDAARELVAEGIDLVVVSLGGDGAVAADADGIRHAHAEVDRPVSTVAAGDCLLAGLLHSLAAGGSTADALTTGVTWGSAAVRLPGSQVPTPRDLADLVIDVTVSPDPTRPLT